MKENPSSDIRYLRLPNIPPAFYENSNFVSAFKRIRNFRSLPTHVCTSKKPGFRLGSFTLPHFSIVWFDSVLRCGVDKIFHQRETKESRAGRILCWLEATHSSSITAGWCCWVHISSHRVPATPVSRTARCPWYKIFQDQLPRMKSIRTRPLLLKTFLFGGAYWFLALTFRTLSTFIEIWSSVHSVLFSCFQLCAYFCSQMHIVY